MTTWPMHSPAIDDSSPSAEPGPERGRSDHGPSHRAAKPSAVSLGARRTQLKTQARAYLISLAIHGGLIPLACLLIALLQGQAMPGPVGVAHASVSGSDNGLTPAGMSGVQGRATAVDSDSSTRLTSPPKTGDSGAGVLTGSAHDDAARGSEVSRTPGFTRSTFAGTGHVVSDSSVGSNSSAQADDDNTNDLGPEHDSASSIWTGSKAAGAGEADQADQAQETKNASSPLRAAKRRQASAGAMAVRGFDAEPAFDSAWASDSDTADRANAELHADPAVAAKTADANELRRWSAQPKQVADELAVPSFAKASDKPRPTGPFGVDIALADGSRPEKIVFAVDASGSLVDTFALLARTVEQSILRLHRNQQFTVLFFQGRNVLEPAPFGLQRATIKRKLLVNHWIDQITPRGQTRPTRALKRALTYQPDAVVLISDDIVGRTNPDLTERSLLETIKKHNRTEVVIDTVQFLHSSSPAEGQTNARAASTLEQIADQTGGHHKTVTLEEVGFSR